MGRMREGKAPGVDEVSGLILKNGGASMVTGMVEIMRRVWDEGRCPREWIQGIIIPVFKDGDRKVASNYRAITLTSLVAKIFGGVVERRLAEWVEKKKLLVEGQGGFRRGRSTVDQILTLVEMVRKRKGQGKSTWVTFLDIRKAYDTVWRVGLWRKMQEIGIGSKMLGVIRRYV